MGVIEGYRNNTHQLYNLSYWLFEKISIKGQPYLVTFRKLWPAQSF